MRRRFQRKLPRCERYRNLVQVYDLIDDVEDLIRENGYSGWQYWNVWWRYSFAKSKYVRSLLHLASPHVVFGEHRAEPPELLFDVPHFALNSLE